MMSSIKNNNSTLNLVHTKTFSVGTTLEIVGNYTIISGIAHCVSVKIHQRECKNTLKLVGKHTELV